MSSSVRCCSWLWEWRALVPLVTFVPGPLSSIQQWRACPSGASVQNVSQAFPASQHFLALISKAETSLRMTAREVLAYIKVPDMHVIVTDLLIHLFKKYKLSNYYGTGAAPGSKDT